MIKRLMLLLGFIGLIFLPGCITSDNYLHIQKVGMLVEGQANERPWDKKGQEALEKIGKEFDVGVYLKENVKTKYEVIQAIEDLVKNGVNLVYGHSANYGRIFVDMSHEYPEVQFIYLKGDYFNDNVTSIKFDAYAIGFFNGVIASKMSESKEVGVLATHASELETEGFYEGAKYQDALTQVHIDFVNDWNKDDIGQKLYQEMKEQDVDVFYSLDDIPNLNLLKKVRQDNLYILGDVDEEEDTRANILATTTESIDKVYLSIADKFNNKKLKSGIIIYGFDEGVIRIGEFNQNIPKSFQKKIKRLIDKYSKENELPANVSNLDEHSESTKSIIHK